MPRGMVRWTKGEATMSIQRVLAALLTVGVAIAAESGTASDPQFTSDNQLIRPANYREWIFLTSGLGMNYGPLTNATANPNPMFDNVFVHPAAYKQFIQTGKWPDKTMFIL